MLRLLFCFCFQFFYNLRNCCGWLRSPSQIQHPLKDRVPYSVSSNSSTPMLTATAPWRHPDSRHFTGLNKSRTDRRPHCVLPSGPTPGRQSRLHPHVHYTYTHSSYFLKTNYNQLNKKTTKKLIFINHSYRRITVKRFKLAHFRSIRSNMQLHKIL